MASINKWKAHSNKDEFKQQFDAITARYSIDNNVRTIKVEEFLITEAQKAGVIKTHPIKL